LNLSLRKSDLKMTLFTLCFYYNSPTTNARNALSSSDTTTQIYLKQPTIIRSLSQ
jgi:hypothetical protein